MCVHLLFIIYHYLFYFGSHYTHITLIHIFVNFITLRRCHSDCAFTIRKKTHIHSLYMYSYRISNVSPDSGNTQTKHLDQYSHDSENAELIKACGWFIKQIYDEKASSVSKESRVCRWNNNFWVSHIGFPFTFSYTRYISHVNVSLSVSGIMFNSIVVSGSVILFCK